MKKKKQKIIKNKKKRKKSIAGLDLEVNLTPDKRVKAKKIDPNLRNLRFQNLLPNPKKKN